MSKFKPCPFCGGMPVKTYYRKTKVQYAFFIVKCNRDNNCKVWPLTSGKTTKEAADNWNTRA